MSTEKDVRRMILSIDERHLMDIFTGRARITNIPEGAIPSHVMYNFRMGCWEVVLEHESYMLVFPGGEYPRFLAEVEQQLGKPRDREKASKEDLAPYKSNKAVLMDNV